MYMETYTKPLIDISGEGRECHPCEDRDRPHAHADYEFEGEPWCKDCFRGADDRCGRKPDRHPHEVAVRPTEWNH